MVRISEIQDRLLSLVGWEQSYNPAEAIDGKLTESESGLYYQGAHPLITLENLRAIIPDDFFFQYAQSAPSRMSACPLKIPATGSHTIISPIFSKG